MISLITAYDMEGYVNGEIIEPKRFLEGSRKLNPTHALWSRINRVIKSWIYGSISRSMIGNVYGKNTTFEMW